MSAIDPFITRCAKQIYHKFQLTDRIQLLSIGNAPLPVEVVKMQQVVLLLDKTKLDNIVKSFLQGTHASKNINDFISKLDQELMIFTPDDEEDDFDDDFDDNLFENFEETAANKRTRSPSPVENAPKTCKKLKSIEVTNTTSTSSLSINKTLISHLKCFTNDTKNAKTHNVICSPSSTTKLFSNTSWIVLYEISRFVQSYKISWDEVPFDAFQMFLSTANTEPARLYEVMVKWNQEKRLGVKVNALSYTNMDRCPEIVWSHLKSMNTDSDHAVKPLEKKQRNARVKNRMIHYSGVIKFKTSDAPPSITLRAPKLEASNRLFRKFGQDRFLELKLAKGTHTSLIKKFAQYFLKPFLFMQRIFRFLFVKDDTIVLFATEGGELENISIQQVIDWHMPITENWSMTMSKYASRMSLGYSSSIPTLEFKPIEIQYVDDIYGSGSPSDENSCMTDGCGIISCSAMKEIMGCQATDELPCAIQGRIAGAKGIWIIAPDLDFTTGNYIQIRQSQNKFKTGLPQADFSLDPHHYIFDLVKNSICVYPSSLNTQFIQCLSAGGVPTEVFVEILKEYVHRLATIVTENHSVKVLRDWVAKAGSIMMRRWEGEENTEKGLWQDLLSGGSGGADDENDSGYFTMDSPDIDTGYSDEPPNENSELRAIEEKGEHMWPLYAPSHKSNNYSKLNKYSGFPAGLHESVVRLLDAGFDLSNAYVATRVTMVFRQIMQAITVKYKIEVPQSCTVTCVPDPTGTLEEDEVFLQLSSRRMDEKTGIRAGQILGDVIVTRNPCGLKSDVQKVKAVDCTALRMYTDIIIFSVKGETSLASKLSGGDYDGDIVFCCWDERIVQPFKSSAISPECSRVKNAFEKDKKTVGQEVGTFDSAEKAIQINFLSVSIPDGTLGVYENWRTVLAERTSLDNPDVTYLAHMCAKLVDAPKQGLKLKAATKSRDRSNFAEMPYPAWFMDKKNKQRGPGLQSYRDINNVYTIQDAPCTTTMDFLYDALLQETAAFTKYSRSMFCDEDVSFKDSDLTAPWIKACELATQLNDPLLKADLDLVAITIRKNKDAYYKQCGEFDQQRQRYIDNIANPHRYQNNKFVDELQSRFNTYFELEEYFAKDYLNSPSTQNLKSNIITFDIQANGGKMLQCIKASYAYILSVSVNKYGKYCYIVAYDALRRIKADSAAKNAKENGIAETVSVSAYKSMNVDRKWLKRIKESNYIEENIEKVRLLTDAAKK